MLFSIKWIYDVKPEEQYMSIFDVKYAEICEKLEVPSDLITSVIFLTSDEYGPSVSVYGLEEDNKNLYCIYNKETIWIEYTGEEIDES